MEDATAPPVAADILRDATDAKATRFDLTTSPGSGVVCLRNGDQRWRRLRGAPCRSGRALELFGGAPRSVAAVSCLYAFAGRTEASNALSDRLDVQARSALISPLFRAWIHVGRGETEPAFQRLEEAVDERDPQAMYLACEPPYDSGKA